MTFKTQTMQEILRILQSLRKSHTQIAFYIFNPDLAEGYAGTKVVYEKEDYIYRGYKTWVDLAELLKCKILTPQQEKPPLIRLTFVPLKETSFHKESKHDEKYGIDSQFSKIYKMEEPAFLYYYEQALENIHISQRKSVLNLGINRGDEFQVIQNILEKKIYEAIKFVGIDHSKTAIAYAKSIFKTKNMHFYSHDINDLNTLNLKKFDVCISIGTLQSPSIDFKPFFMSLIQNYLDNKNSAIILGFPNSRWQGGEMLYGAKVPHYAMSEMGLVLSDILFCKKYLQQKKYRVTITGKSYLFLTATKINI